MDFSEVSLENSKSNPHFIFVKMSPTEINLFLVLCVNWTETSLVKTREADHRARKYKAKWIKKRRETDVVSKVPGFSENTKFGVECHVSV